jgi:hypothetical protein
MPDLDLTIRSPNEPDFILYGQDEETGHLAATSRHETFDDALKAGVALNAKFAISRNVHFLPFVRFSPNEGRWTQSYHHAQVDGELNITFKEVIVELPALG